MGRSVIGAAPLFVGGSGWRHLRHPRGGGDPYTLNDAAPSQTLTSINPRFRRCDNVKVTSDVRPPEWAAKLLGAFYLPTFSRPLI